MRLVRCVVLGVVLSCACVLPIPGGASAPTCCPHRDYPSGVLPAGTEVTCPRCFGAYRVYPHTKPDNAPLPLPGYRRSITDPANTAAAAPRQVNTGRRSSRSGCR